MIYGIAQPPLVLVNKVAIKAFSVHVAVLTHLAIQVFGAVFRTPGCAARERDQTKGGSLGGHPCTGCVGVGTVLWIQCALGKKLCGAAALIKRVAWLAIYSQEPAFVAVVRAIAIPLLLTIIMLLAITLAPVCTTSVVVRVSVRCVSCGFFGVTRLRGWYPDCCTGIVGLA
jgi:hypothetical protein